MSATVRPVTFAFAAASILAACGSSSLGAQAPAPARPQASASLTGEAVERGRLLTSTACASCHATGATGDSPLPDATPLREIAHRYPLNQLEEAFAAGLVTTHPAMPGYNFRASEIDDLIAYLEALKAER